MLKNLITQDAVSGKGLGLEVFDVIDLAIDDCPEAPVFVVILQVGLADEGHLLVVLRALPCEERACRSRAKASYILTHTTLTSSVLHQNL